MSFMEAISICFRKYAVFSGRARRSEYWYFCLFSTIVSAVLGLLLGTSSVIYCIVSIAILLPGLGVSWRRMHDIGKSGAWSFLALVPIVGSVIVIVWCCKDSDPGSNDYGPNPKGM